MGTFWKAPSINYKSTTLNGGINDSATTITVNSATNLQAPGVIVINREDGNGTATPTLREVVSYTGISGNDLTGCTRNVDSSTAKSHGDGSLVETMFTVGMWNDLRDAVTTALTTDGTAVHLSNATISAVTQTARLAVSSIASISTLYVPTNLNASGASVVGFSTVGGFNALFQVPGGLASQANVAGLIPIPTALTAQFMAAYVQTPASIASVSAFILRQGGTVVGMLGIEGGGTYGSSASLAVTSLVAGDNLTLDIRSTASLAQDFSMVLRAT